jgi:hypothetical protein
VMARCARCQMLPAPYSPTNNLRPGLVRTCVKPARGYALVGNRRRIQSELNNTPVGACCHAAACCLRLLSCLLPSPNFLPPTPHTRLCKRTQHARAATRPSPSWGRAAAASRALRRQWRGWANRCAGQGCAFGAVGEGRGTQ